MCTLLVKVSYKLNMLFPTAAYTYRGQNLYTANTYR